MKIKKRLLGAEICLLLFFSLFVNAACSGKNDSRSNENTEESQRQLKSGLPWPALALLQAGDNPLWFELDDEGPKLIESPDAAAITPYIPWPHARYITGILVWKGFLVMAVNRDGFLMLGEGESPEEAVLYRVTDIRSGQKQSFWDPYTAESFFMWQNKPAVLLYRNDFFMDPIASPLNPQVYILDDSSPVPLGISIPALEEFPTPWEAEVIRRGADGFWYCRMKEKGVDRADTVYFRSKDLMGEGSRISIGEWRNSQKTEYLGTEAQKTGTGRTKDDDSIAQYLAFIFEKAEELSFGKFIAVRIVSPDFEEPRFFSPQAAAAPGPTASDILTDDVDDTVLLSGYCRESEEPMAVIVRPGGRGLACSGSLAYGKVPAVRSFSLPALPEDFVYTGIALLGNVLFAAWEEQQEAGIGAAGFMVLRNE